MAMAAHQKKMRWSLCGQLFRFPGGGIWTSLLNSRTTHTQNHHKQIQQRTHLLNSCNYKKKLWRPHLICSHMPPSTKSVLILTTNKSNSEPTYRILASVSRRCHEESHLICRQAWYHLQKMCWSSFGQVFWISDGRDGNTLAQSIQKSSQANQLANPPATEFLQLLSSLSSCKQKL